MTRDEKFLKFKRREELIYKLFPFVKVIDMWRARRLLKELSIVPVTWDDI